MIELRYNADGKLEFRQKEFGQIFFDAWQIVPGVEKEVETPTDNSLRTEKITLEITHDCATNIRDWHCWKRENFPLNPHESLRVVEESETSDRCHRWDRDGERCLKCNDKDWMGGPCNTTDEEYIARLTAERDAAIRERDAARARVAELEAAPPPRGWLTEEEREAVHVMALVCDRTVDAPRANTLRALLAREEGTKTLTEEISAQNKVMNDWIVAFKILAKIMPGIPVDEDDPVGTAAKIDEAIRQKMTNMSTSSCLGGSYARSKIMAV